MTPLGKLDLRGRDVPKLLSMLYTNTWVNLPVGGVRYGVMCNEDGVVFDDGVTGRLGADHYLMTTTSSGAERVWEWAEMWLQTARPDWDVVITPMTPAYTSINLAGPRSRDVLAPLTDINVDSDAFRYFQVRQGAVAGAANCVVWRIGFTGELSYEVHVPARKGLAVWETLLEAGASSGIRPFGVEAQRIMRLEKGHPIIGQDTDGLTTMPALGMDGLIKLTKDDFAGRPELAWALANRSDDDPHLVALQPTDPAVVPAEACQIVRDHTNEIIGRITSSRYSPTLDRSICLGQVRRSHAATNTMVTVVLTNGDRVAARVLEHHAHLDPKGTRLRV